MEDNQIMSSNITVELPEPIGTALAEASREEGISQSELVTAALKDFLFIRKFRRLREKIISQSPETYTDEDVFDSVS
jgi:hypothetical protein